MATRFVGVDSDDPKLPDVVIAASIGTSADTFASGAAAANAQAAAENAASAVDTLAGEVPRLQQTLDIGAITGQGLTLQDDAGHDGIMLRLVHNGTTGSQAYAIDISNRDGAGTAIVIHQYSNDGAAMVIDNTDNQPAIRINNTTNSTLNPDGPAEPTGAFFTLQKAGTTLAQWEPTNTIRNYTTTPLTVSNLAGGVGLAVAVAGASAARAMTVTKASTDNLECLQLHNSGGTGRGLLYMKASVAQFGIDNNGIPEWCLAANAQTTVGAAGAASALPATPTKYLKVKDSAGTVLVVPAYAAS